MRSRQARREFDAVSARISHSGGSDAPWAISRPLVERDALIAKPLVLLVNIVHRKVELHAVRSGERFADMERDRGAAVAL
jgi:hypothetical protein